MRFNEGDDATGVIALETVALSAAPQSLLRTMATSFHDPDDDFTDLVQILPFGPRFQDFAEPAIGRGAGWARRARCPVGDV